MTTDTTALSSVCTGGTGGMASPTKLNKGSRRRASSPLVSSGVFFTTLILFLESFPLAMLLGQSLSLVARQLGSQVFTVTAMSQLIGSIIGMFSTIQIGHLSQPDCLGRRTVLLFTACMSTMSTFVLLFENGYLLVATDCIVMAFGCRYPCGVYSVLCAWISDWAVPSEVSMIITTVNSGFTCGILLGTLVGGYSLELGLVTVRQLIWAALFIRPLCMMVMVFAVRPPTEHTSPFTGGMGSYTNSGVSTDEYLLMDMDADDKSPSTSESPTSTASTVDATPVSNYYESRYRDCDLEAGAGHQPRPLRSATQSLRYSTRTGGGGMHTGTHTGMHTSTHTGMHTGGHSSIQRSELFQLLKRSRAVFRALFKLSPGVMMVSLMHFLNQQAMINSTYLYYAKNLHFSPNDLNFNIFISASLSVLLNATAAPFMARSSFTGMTVLLGCLGEATQNLMITFGTSKTITFAATAISTTGCLIQPVMTGYVIQRTNDLLKHRTPNGNTQCSTGNTPCSTGNTPCSTGNTPCSTGNTQCSTGGTHYYESTPVDDGTVPCSMVPATYTASTTVGAAYTAGTTYTCSGQSCSGQSCNGQSCSGQSCSGQSCSERLRCNGLRGTTPLMLGGADVVDDATLLLLNQGAVVGGFSSMRSFTGAVGPVMAAVLLQGYAFLPWPFCFPTLAFALLGTMMLIATGVVFVAFVLPMVTTSTVPACSNEHHSRRFMDSTRSSKQVGGVAVAVADSSNAPGSSSSSSSSSGGSPEASPAIIQKMVNAVSTVPIPSSPLLPSSGDSQWHCLPVTVQEQHTKYKKKKLSNYASSRGSIKKYDF